MTPDIHTIKEFMLPVGHGHTLYVHVWGNPKAAITILNLHGGPGGGTSDRHKRWYNPSSQRVIFFDQRGAGRSTPHGERNHNTTPELLADITKVLDACDTDRAIIRGGSWGSCLALAYGLVKPERVVAMVLDGIFTGTAEENDWLFNSVYQRFYPEVYAAYQQLTPAKHRDNPSAYHIPRALGDDPIAAKESTYAFAVTEVHRLSLDEHITPEPFDTFDPADGQIEIHYLYNNCFMPTPQHILENADQLTMPLYLVQGRYDMVCPPDTAYKLANTAPNATLIMTVSGHKAERESVTVVRSLLQQLTNPVKL